MATPCRIAIGLLAGCLAIGCGQQDPDIAVRIHTLDESADASVSGRTSDAASPVDCNLQLTLLYGLLESVVEADCHVEVQNPHLRESIVSWLSQRTPATIGSNEPMYVLSCDASLHAPAPVVYAEDEELFVCPAYCEDARLWVRDNKAHVTACADAGM